MTYKTIEEFLKDWEYESGATKKVLNNLTDESLSQKVSETGRSLGFLGWHITETIGEMLEKTGLKVFRPDMANFNEASSDDLRKCYNNACDSLVEKLKANWKDDILQTEDDMYGQMWKKGETLRILIDHQIHHRGQMTVLMRQAGVKVPGFYGPVYEDWATYGMEPHK
jgi:uncharacterized damage-inducible protein DinB